jgi:hypothetical protein
LGALAGCKPATPAPTQPPAPAQATEEQTGSQPANDFIETG